MKRVSPAYTTLPRDDGQQVDTPADTTTTQQQPLPPPNEQASCNVVGDDADPLSSKGLPTAKVVMVPAEQDGVNHNVIMGVPVYPSNGKVINVMHTIQNQTYRLTLASQNATLRDLKEAIMATINVPVDQQRVIFNGRILTGDEMTLNFIPDSGFVHLVPSSRSGAVTTTNDGQTTSSSLDAPSTTAADHADATMRHLDPFMLPVDLEQQQTPSREETIQILITPLRLWSYFIIIWFALLFWGSLSVLTDDRGNPSSNNGNTTTTTTPDSSSSSQEPLILQLVDLCLGLFGIFVGVMGTMASSTSWSRMAGGGVDTTLVLRRLRTYRYAIVTLCAFYLCRIAIPSLIDGEGQAGMATILFLIMYIVMIFSFCIVRVRRVEALVQMS